MKNNSQKILSISHEVKTPLDLNKEKISSKFQQPLTGAITMKKTFALRAIFTVMLVFGFAFNSSAAPAETYVYGNYGTISTSIFSATVGYVNGVQNNTLVAQGFRVGTSAWDIKQVQVALAASGPTSPAASVYLFGDNSGVPGSPLSPYSIVNGPVTISKQTFSFTGSYATSPNTNYWLVLADAHALSQQTSFEWYLEDTGATPSQRNSSGISYLGTKVQNFTGAAWSDTLSGLSLSVSAVPASVTSTLYWLGSNGTLWSAGNNWSSNATGTPTADFADGDDIVFSATGSSNSTNTDLGGDRSIGSLTIDTIDAVGISGGNLTITGSEAVTVSGTSGNVSISAPLILSGSAATLSIENENTTLASVASANGLVKSGNGTLTLTGNNTNNGTTSINAGTLALSGNGTLGNSTISVAGGTLDMGGKSLINTLGNLTAGTLANGTLTKNGSNYNLQNGTVSATLAGTNGVNKTTSGTVILSGSNTYNGTTSINAGTLQIVSASGLGSAGNITFGGGTLQYGNGITEDLSSRIKNSNSAIRIDTNGNEVTFSSSINSTNSSGLVKLGNGTLSLNGNSSYTGGTFIESGTLTGDSQGIKGSITNNATLQLSDGTFVVNVSGSGALLVDGWGSSLIGNATMTGGTTISSGTLTLGNSTIAASIYGNITNNGVLSFFVPSGNLTFAQVISGSGKLETPSNGSPGTLILTGNNTYTGGTTISGGAIDISGGKLDPTGSITVIGGVLMIGNSSQTVGNFTLNGASASASGSGSLTASQVDLLVGSASLGFAGAADLVKTATLSPDPNSYQRGIVSLTGNNTNTGNITVNGGILSFDQVKSLYSGNNASWTKEKITVNATFALATGTGNASSGFSDDQIKLIAENLSQDSTLGGFQNGSSLGFNVGSNFTLTNATVMDTIDGAKVGMDKFGNGTLTLNNTNTFTGGLKIFAGAINLGRSDALSGDSNLYIRTYSTPSAFNIGNFDQTFSDVTLYSGNLLGSTGTLTTTGNYVVINGNATANLSGNASLTKTGTIDTEIVYLSGNNSYTGTTTINGLWSDKPLISSQRLQFQTAGALYSANQTSWTGDNITVNSKGILSVRSDSTGAAGFTDSQISTLIANLATANRASGGFANNSTVGIDTAGASFTLTGNITNATGRGAIGLAKFGNGTLTLSGNNSHSLFTTILGGTLATTQDGALGAPGTAVYVESPTVPSTRVVLDIGSTTQTVGKVRAIYGDILGNGTLAATGFELTSSNVTVQLADAPSSVADATLRDVVLSANNTFSGNASIGGTVTYANANAAANATTVHGSPFANLTLGVPGTTTYNLGGFAGSNDLAISNNTLSIGSNGRNTVYSGNFSGTGGSIVKVGNGTLTLSGNNTHTGGTTVSAGTLQIGNGTTTGSVTGNINNNANLVFNRSNNYDYFGVVSGTGNVTQAGSGTLTLGGTQTYTGSTTVTSGTLWLGGSATLASTVVNIASGGMFYDYGSGLSQNTTVQNSGRFDLGSLDETVGSISGNGTIQLVGNLTTGGLGYDDLISGTISGFAASSLIKVGTGTLTLTGSATNGGGLVISNGILSIGNGGATGSVTGNITNNAALAFNRSNEYTYNGIVSGNGTLEQLGTGTTILGGNNTYSGGTIITAGTLQGTTQSLQGAITNNATLVFNQTANGTYAGVLGGTGVLSKNGTGTLTLSGTGSFSGTTAINTGTLAVTGSLANAATQINSGATLTGSGSLGAVTINSGGILTGNGTAGAVTINTGGSINPGNSPGTITVGNSVWNSGGIYNWELSNANGTAGTDWDLISSSGNLRINADSDNRFTINARANKASGFDSTHRYYSWKIAEFSGGITDFSAGAFDITTTGFEPGLGVYTVSANNTALRLNYATMATWNAGTGNWTTTGNWEGDFAPINGVAVEYAGPLGTNGTSTNNDTNLASISGLAFTNSANGSFSVAGGDLEIGDGGIVNNSTFTQTVGLNITLGADQTFAANTANLVVSGSISGNASLTKEGSETLVLSGSNSYTGETTIASGTMVIASSGSLTGTSKIFVGNSTSGNTLDILGSVSAGNLTLSHQVGSDNNTVSVGDGSSPASLTVANLINVGFGGTGNTLDILGDGTVTAASTWIGGYGASNTVNLTGGVLNSTTDVIVGYFAGENALNITAGGNTTAGSIIAGLDVASANNTILVSGSNSALNTAGLIYLGQNGTSNSLVIENGGKVVSQNADVVIGFNASSNGNALSINGTGSQFTNNSTLYVGKGGSENTLSIANGASLTTRNSRIGHDATSSNNTATVSGNGSTWANAGTLRVGSTGSGNTLAVTNGGNVTVAGNTFIGHGVTSANNLISVEGAGSVLNLANATIGLSGANNTLLVADLGTINAVGIQLSGTNSTLQIGNGAAAGTINTSLGIGTGTGSGHQVVFNHTDSSLSFSPILTGNLSVRQIGTGKTVLASNNTYTGTTTVNNGTLEVASGGSINGTSDVSVGILNGDNGTFNLNGGSVSNARGYLGAQVGSVGAATVSAGNWTHSGSLFVGVGGTGSLTINGTGHVTNEDGYVGHFSGSTGTVGVSGGTWTNNINLFIGNEGTGSLTISGTGNVTSMFGYVGNLPGGNGTVSVSGGTWTNNLDLSIGNGGTGSLAINGTGNVTSMFGYIGTLPDGNGTVSVSGGTWTNSSSLTIGIGGTGSLTISGTGTVIVGDTLSRGSNGTINLESGGTLQIGYAGTTGTLATDLTNNGTLIFDVTDSSTSGYAISGTGAVIKNGNGTLILTGTSTYTGSTSLNAGTLEVNGSLANTATTVNSGGTLGGNGTLGDVTINSGGGIAPGNSPGTITVANLTLNGGSIYNWQLGNATGTAGQDWDLISSLGTLGLNATSSNITLSLSTFGDSTLAGVRKASWEIANSTHSITGFNKNAFAIDYNSMNGSDGRYFMSLGGENKKLILNYKTAATWNTGSGNWTTESQWEDDFLPTDGDAVEFIGAGGISTNNFLSANLSTISGISFLEGAGAYTVNGNTLQIGGDGIVNASSNLQTIGMNLTAGEVLTVDTVAAGIEISGVVSGNSSLTKTGFDTLTLSGNNSYKGGTTISEGTLALGGTAGAVTGNISVNAGATFAVNRTSNASISNLISGAGSLAQVGTAVTSILGNNTYTGGTYITSGMLWAKSEQALGNGRVMLGQFEKSFSLIPPLSTAGLLVSSRQEMGGNLRIDGNLDWYDGKIAYFDTGSSPLSGDLTINVAGSFNVNTVGNATFDFSGVEALDSGNYTLVNATSVFADNSKFTAVHGPYTTLFGNFTTSNNTVVYTVTGAVSGGSDIRNNGGPNTPVVANYNITGPTITIGEINQVNALTFSSSAPLAIQSNGELIVTSGTLAVQTGSSVVSGGTLVAPEGLNKDGTGELDFTNNVVVNGTAAVNAGLLSVNGQLQATGGVVVNPNATLGGAGLIVGNVNVTGGNLSPGNSPGTLSVAGNLVLTGANATIIEIASPTNFDRIVVSGTATLGGTLNAVAYGGGTITPGARYDFLQAGSIDGEFASLIAPDGLRIRFLNSGTVGTLLFGPASFVPYALNQNQINVAKALDIFVLATEGDAIVVGTALDSLTTEQFPAAFDQIMPGFYESLANIAIEQVFAQTQMLNQRISSVRLGAAGFQAIGGISQPLVHDKNGKSAAEAKDASPIVESATATNWNAWALGTGTFSRSTNLGSLQNYNNDAGGFLVGADYRWSENFVTGLYGGYDYSYAEYNGGGSTKGNSFSFGTYASYEKDGYYADAVIGGGYTGFQTQRSIEFSTIDRTASADPNSGQFTAGLNLGKDFEVGKFTLGPIVGAQYTYAGIGSFTESGAESLDLSLGQQNANSLRSTLGGRIAYTWNLNQKIALIPEVRMFWQHEFLNNARNINASLDGGSGASFDYETTDPYRDSVFAGAGVTAQFGERWNASLFYNINFGSQTYQSNMVSAGLNFSF